MKPNERTVLRELNKSVFIKYPIKENITTTAHKISLMIQNQLGGAELLGPDGKDFNTRQYATDKTIIFDRIQRLIRCIIDCKSADCDAIATRYALELARSLSAEFWENSNLQLRQVPQIGPVAHRKLVAGCINSIEKLFSLDPATVERIVSKNPPFGMKMLDCLISFPHLTLTGEILGNAHYKAGELPQIKVRSVLGFSNKQTPIWCGRKPSLTFIAETSDGKLVHFWRGNIQQLSNSHELKYTVELSCPDDTITCYVACDEIVGTVRSFTLKSNVPASAFPISKPESTTASNVAEIEVDEFGTTELEDDEFLAAVNVVEAHGSIHGSDYFSDVDEAEEVISTERNMKEKKPFKILESVQMENGKWTCNHSCRDGQPTKTGQKCKHRCCKEGLDKPRKIRKKAMVSKTPCLLAIYLTFL
jgi:ATP-dependent DNA helicase HFM1/MER3